MTVTYRPTRRLVDAWTVKMDLNHLNAFYPGFDEWFLNKALPDVLVGDGVLVVAEEHGQIVGAALGRRGERPKLRCIRVAPEASGRGIGLHLIDKALDEIGCDRPAVTVPEEVLHVYSRHFINRFDFDLDHVARGLYRAGRLEYLFNDPAAREAHEKTTYGEPRKPRPLEP